jgi:hypothetical protein
MTAVLSREEGRKLLQPKRKSKYGNRKVTHDGITFDSVKEYNRYLVLRAKQAAGIISHLETQPKFKLYGRNGAPVLIRSARYKNGRHAVWKGDFAYFCSERNKRICEDVKGVRTQVFILKRAIVEACYPGLEIVEI